MAMPAVAITDHANLFALVKFYKAALAEGIKPIAGCDVYVSDQSQMLRQHSLFCWHKTRPGTEN